MNSAWSKFLKEEDEACDIHAAPQAKHAGMDEAGKKKECCKSWKKGKRCKKCPLRK